MLHHVFESCKTDADVREAEAKVVKLINDKKVSYKDLSIYDIAESTLGSVGMRALREAGSEECFVGVQEAVSPVNLSAFTNITGLMVYEASVEAYKAPEFIGSQLVTEETAREDGGTDIGLANIDDDVLEVKEGEEFPTMKFSEDYIGIPTSVKRGAKIGLTRELVFFDKTGKLIEMAQSIGTRLGTNKEKRILRTFLGIDNSFTRKGTAINTYLTTGNRINQKASFALEDWTDIDEALQVFADMGDDRTSAEPIMVTPDTLVVAPALQFTARRILSATETRKVTNTNNTTIGGNPVPGMNVISSPWIPKLLISAASKTAAQANAYWHMGQPKKAFKYRTLFPFQVRAAQHDKDEFERDVVAQFRVDERGTPRIVAPWYNAQFYNT